MIPDVSVGGSAGRAGVVVKVVAELVSGVMAGVDVAAVGLDKAV